MMIETVTAKYRLYRDGHQFVVTTRKGAEVCRGSRQECEKFMEQNPYGVRR